MRKQEIKHSYYKTPEASETGKALTVFFERCKNADRQAHDWVKRQGADHYYDSFDVMAGGVSMIEFDDHEKHEGFERFTYGAQQVGYFPVAGSEKETEMTHLPIVPVSDLVDVLQLVDERVGSDKRLMNFGDQTPVIYNHQGSWYFSTPFASQSSDVVPISKKEFFRRRMARTNEL